MLRMILGYEWEGDGLPQGSGIVNIPPPFRRVRGQRLCLRGLAHASRRMSRPDTEQDGGPEPAAVAFHQSAGPSSILSTFHEVWTARCRSWLAGGRDYF